jgi:hypothetical protein
MAYKAETIRKKCDAVFKSADRLKVRIHTLAVIILEHYKVHGDTSLMAYLVNGMAKSGVHRRALIQWFQTYGRVQGVIQNNEMTFSKRKNADHTAIDIDRANTSPYYDDDSVDGRTNEDLKGFNVFGRMRAAIKKARELKGKADLKEAGYDADKTVLGDEELLAKFEELIEIYGDLDKPQSKADKPLFDIAKGAGEPETLNVVNG